MSWSTAAAKAERLLLGIENRKLNVSNGSGWVQILWLMGMSAVGFQGDGASWLITEKGSAVWVDFVTVKPVRRVVKEDLTAHQRISEMADPIHFGTCGGLATKLAWLLFGLLLTGLAAMGVIIYATRLHGGWCLGRARRGLVGSACPDPCECGAMAGIRHFDRLKAG